MHHSRLALLTLALLAVSGCSTAKVSNSNVVQPHDTSSTIRNDKTFEVLVIGRVKKPGIIHFPAGATVTVEDALKEAGGLSSPYPSRGAMVTRALADGTKMAWLIDLTSKDGTANAAGLNFVIQSEDKLFVPHDW